MKKNKNHSTPQPTTKKENSLKATRNLPLKAPKNDSILNVSVKRDFLEATAITMKVSDFAGKPNIIFLNPSTILSTSFNFFGYVVAEYNSNCVVCLLYPDQGVGLNCVLVSDFVSSSLNIQQNTPITLSHVQEKIPIASEVYLKYNSPEIKKDNPIFEYATQQLEGIVIKSGSVINLHLQDVFVILGVIRLTASANYDNMNSTLGFNASKESINETDLTLLMDSLTLFKGDNKINSDPSPMADASLSAIDSNKYGFFVRKNITKLHFVSAIGVELFHDSIINPQTDLQISLKPPIYGFEKVFDDLFSMIVLPLKNGYTAKTCGLMIPQGFLIYGHRGCGKSSIVEKLCDDSGIKSMWIDLKQIKREFEDPISHIYGIFNGIYLSKEPTIVVLEDCETYFPKDSKGLMNDDLEELCEVFLSNVNALRKRAQAITDVCVAFVGTCSDISALSPNVYQNGMFDMEYEIPIPTVDNRFKLLEGFLSRTKHHLDTKQIKYLANHTHGYLPKDLVLLTQLSSIQALRRYHLSQHGQQQTHEFVKLTFDDFTLSIREINPSVIKAFTTDIPKIRWDDIGGMDDVKNHLKECILWPILYSDKLSMMGIEPSSGVLLYGPPGCSKTMMARALAGESQMNFISIKGPELLNKYVGETEKTIRELFKKARLATPCILFFDEIDAIAGQRDASSAGHSDFNDRILAQFLTEIDGIAGNNSNLFVVAATNRPFSIDSALMRPGRFDRLVHVPLPDIASRKSIFEIQFEKIPLDGTINIHNLIECTHGYSGAEIVALCKEAAYCALRENLRSSTVSMEHFNKALANVRPRITPSLLQMYSNFKDQHYKV